MLPLQDPQVPEYARTCLRLPLQLWVAGLVAVLIVFLSERQPRMDWPLAMLAGAALLNRVWYNRIEARLRQQLIEIDFQACRRCGYNLRGMNGYCGCPECGLRQSVAESTEAWSKWVDEGWGPPTGPSPHLKGPRGA